ncbi:hypothetical protein SUGI_0881330 [Cryptomeria japonica]|nr:hypothetical protein SUGI_0881330 [Cryptomeria japonica]
MGLSMCECQHSLIRPDPGHETETYTKSLKSLCWTSYLIEDQLEYQLMLLDHSKWHMDSRKYSIVAAIQKYADHNFMQMFVFCIWVSLKQVNSNEVKILKESAGQFYSFLYTNGFKFKLLYRGDQPDVWIRQLQEPSIYKECPVCKTTVVEDKVIPLYGRGKVRSADPRTKSVPDVSIPHRPSGQRPHTVRTDTDHHYQSHDFNFMAGPGHMPVGSFGDITFSAGFGLFPSLFGFQMHGFAGAPYGSAGMPNGFNHGRRQHPMRQHRLQKAFLSRLSALHNVGAKSESLTASITFASAAIKFTWTIIRIGARIISAPIA